MGAGGEVVMTHFTRRNTPPRAETIEWLVLVGDSCREYWLQMCVPDEDFVRRQLCLPDDVPILIGCA